MTPYEFQALLKAASKDFHRLNEGTTSTISNSVKAKAKKNKSEDARVHTAITQSNLRQSLEQGTQVKTRSTISGTKRIGVIFTCFRSSLLDTDNKFGSVKYALDALRYAGLIADDKESDIELIVNQYKCKRSEQCTTIDLVYY
jgi:Holliday junction resolvase RusA-like endonuclease